MHPLVFVQCFLSEDSAARVADLRPQHLRYITQWEFSIQFGGVVESAGGIEQICYFLKNASLGEAEEFVKADPYYPCYAQVRVSPFIQKIPRQQT